MRNTSRWERQFTGHTGPAFSIDWHPEDKNWIASAGRDRQIKVRTILFTAEIVLITTEINYIYINSKASTFILLTRSCKG